MCDMWQNIKPWAEIKKFGKTRLRAHSPSLCCCRSPYRRRRHRRPWIQAFFSWWIRHNPLNKNQTFITIIVWITHLFQTVIGKPKGGGRRRCMDKRGRGGVAGERWQQHTWWEDEQRVGYTPSEVYSFSLSSDKLRIKPSSVAFWIPTSNKRTVAREMWPPPPQNGFLSFLPSLLEFVPIRKFLGLLLKIFFLGKFYYNS